MKVPFRENGSVSMKIKHYSKNLIIPIVVMLAFWGLGTWGFLASGYAQPLIMFGYIGTSLGVGLGLYATLPKKKKPLGRRLTVRPARRPRRRWAA